MLDVVDVLVRAAGGFGHLRVLAAVPATGARVLVSTRCSSRPTYPGLNLPTNKPIVDAGFVATEITHTFTVG